MTEGGRLLYRHKRPHRGVARAVSAREFSTILEAVINSGRLVAPSEVLHETAKRSDELHGWLSEREHMFHELLRIDHPFRSPRRSQGADALKVARPEEGWRPLSPPFRHCPFARRT